MKNLLKFILCAIILDLFFFSSVFTFTRGVNSKLILGVLGLLVFIYNNYKAKGFKVSKELILLTILASSVSLASLFSMIYNNTGDDAYFSYVISMLVWLAAAYFVSYIIKISYGSLSVERIADFVIFVSFVQCTVAILGDIYVPVNDFIKMLVPGTGWLDSVDRMYGIGDMTALDSGGIRYAIACIFCAHMLVKTADSRKNLVPWYVFAFVFITIIGNMIARTTSVGSVIALIYLMVHSSVGSSISRSKFRVFLWFVSLVFVIILIAIWLYDTNEIMHKNLRFAFEGFFNFIETGSWRTASSDKLMTMYVWPDNPKTWFLGDGYFNNPDSDPNYLGEITEGYYMNTDVGYLRFVFYFGVIGLIFFSTVILYAGHICYKRFPRHRLLFAILTMLNFIIWFKVATDCFFVLAMFIALSYIEMGSEDVEMLKSAE